MRVRLVGRSRSLLPVALLAVVFVYPILILRGWRYPSPPSASVHFRTFFDTPAYVRAMVTTLRVSAFVTVLAVVLGTIDRLGAPGVTVRIVRALLWSAVLFPLWESIVVRNYAFTILLQSEGLLNGRDAPRRHR